jgi:hypothetical protein
MCIGSRWLKCVSNITTVYFILPLHAIYLFAILSHKLTDRNLKNVTSKLKLNFFFTILNV